MNVVFLSFAPDPPELVRAAVRRHLDAGARVLLVSTSTGPWRDLADRPGLTIRHVRTDPAGSGGVSGALAGGLRRLGLRAARTHALALLADRAARDALPARIDVIMAADGLAAQYGYVLARRHPRALATADYHRALPSAGGSGAASPTSAGP
ncbi:hypothetical protein GCM10010124_01090 [Pilimelia terevasa]|uniref:Uncharacterized protein n=1 Tax=Pilimelia terevasa TaxID=53372 RepID=A0A8J3BHX3_9ACTN|nr:hypothetical protein [Pilimelia terevasa]GGK12359.1 hypothetical protein GCM10010124_01090 [Pilimelia terevasa]